MNTYQALLNLVIEMKQSSGLDESDLNHIFTKTGVIESIEDEGNKESCLPYNQSFKQIIEAEISYRILNYARKEEPTQEEFDLQDNLEEYAEQVYNDKQDMIESFDERGDEI